MMRSAASGPATERAWRTASRRRARRIAAGSASSERWSPAGGPKPSARRRSTSVGDGSSDSFWPEHEPHPPRVGQRLAERHARAPGAALDQLGGEHDRAQRPAAPLAAGQQAVDQQLQPALELDARGRLRQLEPLLQPLGRRARDERRVLALREVARERAGGAEAVGQRGARELRQLAERADPEALQRVGQHRHLRARQQQRDRQRRHVGGERRGGQRRDLRRAGRARGWRRRGRRSATAPRRGGDRPAPASAPARGASRPGRPSSVPPWSVFNPPAPNQAMPGGPDSTAAPMPSSARTWASQASATPAGSGATRRSVGQRASASPSRSPARRPYASAAAETSPMNCSRPGSGASATGPAASTSRPPAATASAKRGSRTQTITNICSHVTSPKAKQDARLRRQRAGRATQRARSRSTSALSDRSSAHRLDRLREPLDHRLQPRRQRRRRAARAPAARRAARSRRSARRCRGSARAARRRGT